MAIIPSLPINLQNGTTADATQVMANFTAIQSDVNTNAAHSGANSDITALTGLLTPIPINEGGTGATTASAARTALGLGAASVEALGNNIVDDGAGNLVVKAASILSSMLNASGVTLPNGSAATTQSPGDNTTKVATDAFVTAAVAVVSAVVTALAARFVIGTPCVQNPIVSNTVTTQAHGLANKPTAFNTYLECVTADTGYNVGDRIPVSGSIADGSTGGFTASCDATNVYIATFNPVQIAQVAKAGGTDFFITLTSWKIVVVPYYEN